MICPRRLCPHEYVSQTFFLCYKHLNLREEGFLLAHTFRRFKSMVSWLYCCGPLVRQNMMVARTCGKAKLLPSWWPGSRDRQRWAHNKMWSPKTQSQSPTSSKSFHHSQEYHQIMNPPKICPVIRSEPSGSNHLLKAHQLPTMPFNTWAFFGRYFLSTA
jgi:hypothetical protein